MVNLIETYNEMIRNDKTTQEQINDVHDGVRIDYFIRPNNRLILRGGRKSNGEIIEGMHVYPDKKSIEEMLLFIQNEINKNINEIKNKSEMSVLVFIAELVNICIRQYFGEPLYGENERTGVYHFDSTGNEKMANLSDFKGNSKALCLERTLASHILLNVIINNEILKKYFPYKPFMHITNYYSDATKSNVEGHVVNCLIDHNQKIYLLDVTNYGHIIDNKGNNQDICGLYELTQEESIDLLHCKGVVPTLLRVKHLSGITQTKYRGFVAKKNDTKVEKKDVSGQKFTSNICEVYDISLPNGSINKIIVYSKDGDFHVNECLLTHENRLILDKYESFLCGKIKSILTQSSILQNPRYIYDFFDNIQNYIPGTSASRNSDYKREIGYIDHEQFSRIKEGISISKAR